MKTRSNLVAVLVALTLCHFVPGVVSARETPTLPLVPSAASAQLARGRAEQWSGGALLAAGLTLTVLGNYGFFSSLGQLYCPNDGHPCPPAGLNTGEQLGLAGMVVGVATTSVGLPLLIDGTSKIKRARLSIVTAGAGLGFRGTF